MRKFKDFSLKSITIIQLIITLAISLIFLFFIPDSWNPLIIHMGDEAHNYVLEIFTLSQWFFSISIAWLIYRDNPIINNFLVWVILPFSVIFYMEFFLMYLFYDYFHLTPFIIVIYIFIKKKDTLKQGLIIFFTIFLTIWFSLVYYSGLAYQGYPLIFANLIIFIYPIGLIFLSFFFKNNKK